MRSEKGITVVSLIIYVSVLLAVVLMVGKITTFFYSNTGNIQSVSTEANYNKLNLYIIDNVKKEQTDVKLGNMEDNNDKYKFIEDTSEANKTAIQFITTNNSNSTTNTIGKVGDSIYYNKIKLCDNVNDFKVSKKIVNGKEKISIELKFENNETYGSDYILRYKTTN